MRIRLLSSVLVTWMEKIQRIRFGQCSHSIFAEYLLHDAHGNSKPGSKLGKQQTVDGNLSGLSPVFSK